MTQVSRIPLHKEVEKRVYEVLMESIAVAKTQDVVDRLLNDLLSPIERLMIAKRLSIALLLIKKHDQRTIAQWLNVSLTTVSKVSMNLQTGKGGYQSVIGAVLRKEELRSLILKIDDALAEFLAPQNRNMQHWRKRRLEEKIRNSKPF